MEELLQWLRAPLEVGRLGKDDAITFLVAKGVFGQLDFLPSLG